MKKLLIVVLCLLPTSLYAQTALQNYQPGFRTIDGSQLNKMVAIVNNLQGAGTAQPATATIFNAGNGTVALPSFTFTSDVDTGLYRIGANNLGVTANGAKVLDIGTTGLGVTGVVTTTGAITATTASATALSVGRLGATTPALLVDASTATSITGIKIKSAAASGGVAVSAVGEASNGNLTIDAQGSGTISLGTVSTGNIVMGAAVTGVSSSVTGGFIAKSATAVPASAGAIAAGAPITMFSGGNKIWITSDVPAFSATKGDICINTGGSSTSTRLYINNGTTNWIAITTAS